MGHPFLSPSNTYGPGIPSLGPYNTHKSSIPWPIKYLQDSYPLAHPRPTESPYWPIHSTQT
ncbi:hypothetical protein PAXRUDRAFT_18603 [Paxillus rubicundulus Ve08.2h10]|uniref:Uncharacterized protein n=1 Tax=Paxillus rubicundulus Ve08.2h10 TaxID=930991 RepID=A0A0D0DEF5_9AGAM|nr:hypothetical protein PAXRUDRAFT_18603 [Paxillus rubicundulus Ve08.2h10]